MAPKRQQKKKTGASSSGSRRRNMLSTQQYAKDRMERFEGKEVMNIQYLDFEVLQEYGMKDVIQNMVVDKTWFKVFDIREPAYKNLTLEFLSTLKQEQNEDLQNVFTFQVYGEVYSVVLQQIGVVLGLYEDVSESINLPNKWPDHMTEESYWFQLIHPKRTPFVPSKSLATTFQRKEHMLLHHIISHTVGCRKTSHGKLTTFDMFYLFSLITGYRIDLGLEIANFILRQAEDPRTGVVLCGGYITLLLKGMGIFQLPEDDEEIQSKRISSSPFRNWGIPKVPRERRQAEAIAEPRRSSPAALQDRPSSSSHPQTSSSGLNTDHLAVRIDELKNEVRQEKKKNKRFRSSLCHMLKSAFSCINQEAADKFQYDSSPASSSDSSAPES